MSGRGKRVLIYTASLLIAPMPIMPFVKGEREYVLAIMACGFILTLSGFYVVRGEMKLKGRPLVGTKLLIAALITLLFGMSLFVGAIVYLSRV